MRTKLIPQRQSLLAETTRILREAIQSEKWDKALPGERILCAQMQIGRDTLRLAIKQLEREGLVARSEPGKPRRVIQKKGGRKVLEPETGIIGFLTPHPYEDLSEFALLEINVLQNRLAGTGYRLEIVDGSAASVLSRPAKALETLVDSLSPDSWILHQSTAPIQTWFETRGIPCLLFGQPHEGIDLPFVDIDYLAVGRHAGGLLIGHGHRQVALIRPPMPLRGLEMARTGLLEAYTNHNPTPLPEPLHIAEPNNRRPPHSALNRLLNRSVDRPTALVATRPRQVLSILSWLAQKRLKVPDDLSIIALDHSPFLDHLIPQITCYKIDFERTAETVHRMVIEQARSGGASRGSHSLMPDFLAGRSVRKQ